ncbi:MAG: Flp family type IVb pilin [Acidobacteriia bacterium]|nr:Flp family type IVb pilin [Terriglobia bacterium]
MRWKILWGDDRGQDLIEYTLLLAFVVLAAAGLFLQSSTAISGIWGATSSNLSAASTTAAS